jgi:hypothetical protein
MSVTEISWIDLERNYVLENMRSGKYENIITLEDNYEKCEETKKINIPLREHQKRTVKAMCDLENKRYVTVDLSSILFNGPLAQQITNSILETSAGVLSEKPGAGKTLEILSIIAIRGNNIKLVPEISTIEKYGVTAKKKRKMTMFSGFVPDIKRIYRKVIKTTLIFVGRVVMEQWKASIENYTTLSYMSIENVKDMWYLNDLLCNNPAELSKYDIILVKNGKISGSFTPDNLKGSHIYDKKLKNILSVFGEICKNMCFSRVVLDDFDQLGVPSDALTIPSIFTWFVSSTKQPPEKNSARGISYSPINQIFKGRQPYHASWKNAELFTMFNISASSDFVDHSCNAAVIEYMTYVIDIIGDNYIGLMNNLGEAGARVGHMINAGAIVSGARDIGIKGEHANLLMEIFGKIIDMQWDEYHLLDKTKKYIAKIREYLDELTENDDDDSAQQEKWERSVRHNVTKKQNFKKFKELVRCVNSYITALINDIAAEVDAKIRNSKVVIDRVRESLREGDCPISMEPLAGQEIVITKCCGKVISMDSYSKWVGEHNSTCPLCRNKIESGGFIIVNKEVDHESFLNDENYDYDAASTTEEEAPEELDDDDSLDDSFLFENPVAAAKAKQLSELKNIDKINATLFIIMGMEERISQYYDAEIKNKIKGIMHGDNDVPYSGRKFIVYNDTSEFTKALKPKLLALNIAFAELKGTIKHTANIVRRYRLPADNAEAINVLIISGPEYCAGSDLQVTDAIIFTHQMRNINTEKQVGGRGARIGRTGNLRIYRILHPNERIKYANDVEN